MSKIIQGMKTFALRIDLESEKGISKGLPNLLNLLKEFGFKASFYLAMGGESNPLELIKYNGKLSSAGERTIRVFSTAEKIRMVILPKDFAVKNRIILKRILEEGHELGIHGWKHREWTRGLNRINVEKTVDKSVKKYTKIFGKQPESFTSPGFNTNQKVIEVLNKKNLRVISDFPGEKRFKINGTQIVNVPITICGKNKTPIIEYLVSEGLSDKEIYFYLTKKIKEKEFSSMYIHDLFECIEKINLLRMLFNFFKDEKINVKTIKEIAEEKRYYEK